MTPPPVPEFRPAPVNAWRCVRHPDREAAVRCPSCGHPYCRECAVEHEGRLLCASCLAKTRQAATKPERDRARLRRLLAVGAAAGVLWLLFFQLAELLGRIPPEFHDATLWKEAVSKPEPPAPR